MGFEGLMGGLGSMLGSDWQGSIVYFFGEFLFWVVVMLMGGGCCGDGGGGFLLLVQFEIYIFFLGLVVLYVFLIDIVFLVLYLDDLVIGVGYVYLNGGGLFKRELLMGFNYDYMLDLMFSFGVEDGVEGFGV